MLSIMSTCEDIAGCWEAGLCCLERCCSPEEEQTDGAREVTVVEHLPLLENNEPLHDEGGTEPLDKDCEYTPGNRVQVGAHVLHSS